ncbi:MerC domain-containing protein [Microbulbifer agarilyticus]|uniref:MerC domain-containing protein n=1 Tax=Microbulbifer agarilyticus TaxID=260552 RepID=UPI001C968CDB|nr:MerC domain-containing protein [Microbulbifer agarilyticus]MBY6190335.1 MerC domain-containing protein [Microbulbifer agarilyticus]
MTTLQYSTDKAAIGLSILCTAHCLLVPLLILLVPSIATLTIAGEQFHQWMVAAVLPTSIYALAMGCKAHKQYRFAAMGVAGLALLVIAIVLRENAGEFVEKGLTLTGAALLALAHFQNYRRCQQHGNCNCH